jgi:hypothetical protein
VAAGLRPAGPPPGPPEAEEGGRWSSSPGAVQRGPSARGPRREELQADGELKILLMLMDLQRRRPVRQLTMAGIAERVRYEEDLQEGWLYILFDDEGRLVVLDRDRWEALHRPSPEDQGH